MSFLAICLIICSSLLLWLLFIKRPTSKLPPGPWPIPIIGNLHLLGPLPHRSLAKLAQHYGPIMSLKLGLTPTVVITSPEAAELFLKQHDIVFGSRPAMQFAAYLFYGVKDMAFAPSEDYWRWVRKMCTLHLLSVSKVESFEELRRREIETMVGRMKNVAEVGGVVEVDKVIGELIEEITFKMVVGKEKALNCISSDDTNSLSNRKSRCGLNDVVRQLFQLAGAANFDDFLPFLAFFDLQGLTKKMKQLNKKIDEILEDIIDDHLKDKNFGQQQDLLGSMLALMNDPGNDGFSSTCFGRDIVKAIMLDMFSAGIDTTSLTITWAISALLKHPRVIKLVQQELDTVVGKSRMVQESDLPMLPYLDMVVKETLRLYPVGPLLVPRESMQDVVVDGWNIPKKALIIINFWAIARDPKVWSDNANEFYPERFIDKDHIDFSGNNFEYFPFGSGRRRCPGKQLALLTVKIVLACVLHCFDLALPNGMQSEDVNMTEKSGLGMGRADELLVVPSFRL